MMRQLFIGMSGRPFSTSSATFFRDSSGQEQGAPSPSTGKKFFAFWYFNCSLILHYIASDIFLQSWRLPGSMNRHNGRRTTRSEISRASSPSSTATKKTVGQRQPSFLNSSMQQNSNLSSSPRTTSEISFLFPTRSWHWQSSTFSKRGEKLVDARPNQENSPNRVRVAINNHFWSVWIIAFANAAFFYL